MSSNVLLPDTTAVADGQGAARDIGLQAAFRQILTLEITRISEHQLLEVSVWTSWDGLSWDSSPIAKFPPKFCCGTSSMPLDLSARANAKFVRVRWKMTRSPKDAAASVCDFHVSMEEPTKMRAAVA